jgi:uncharacterized protein (TIGR03083 family)
MGARPLRHFYDGTLDIEVAPELGAVVEPWARHRRRFVDALEQLTPDQWTAITRCDAWDARDVICHLMSADSFWVISLSSAVAGTPTTFLADFDPAVDPEQIVAPMRSMSTDGFVEQFRAGTEAFIEAVESMDESDWSHPGESPVGHVPARLVLAHALWDSWLHERDILLPLGIDVPVEADELAVSTWYLLAFGAAQGGLVDEPDPVGPGLAEPFDLSLAFTDLPGWSVRLVVDRAVRAERGGPDAVECGAAVDVVEHYSGRGSRAADPLVPEPLHGQLARARDIL